MTRTHAPLLALLLTAVLAGSNAHPQAAPSVADVLQGGQEMPQKQRMQDEISLLRAGARFGNSTGATQLDELKSFFGRLTGRFRIDGLIEEDKGNFKQGSRISGIADCAAVGEGLGVHCIINATWPAVDLEVARIGSMESRTERINTFRPAVLVLGFVEESLRVRSLLVTADSIAHGGLGRLDESTVRLNPVGDCQNRCFLPILITAEPEGEVVTMLLRNITIVITFTMHRDPDARATSKVKSMRSR